MNSTPLFSVLMANYNDSKYIDNAIESVKKQTYSNWEIIIVDDASPDNSIDVYKKYEGDPRIHIYFNEKNYGCGYTKHKCVDLSNGEICGFVDADDAITPDAIEIMVNEHVKNPDASLIYSYLYFCDKELRVQRISNHQCQIPRETTYLEYKNNCVSHFATFKRILYDKTTGINELFLIAEDLDLYYKLEEVGRLIHIPRPLYYYRTGNSTHISLGEKVQYTLIWCFLAKSDACRRRGVNIEKYSFPYIDEIISIHVKQAIQNNMNTPDYRIGNFLLKPFRWVKKHFAK